MQLVSPRTAFWITDILADDEARAFIFGRGSQLEFPFPVAVKTGTSQAYHDNWTVGSSRHVTVGVWVGNFDRSPLIGSSGVTGAGPLFHAVMLAAEARAAGGITPSDGAVAGSAGAAGRGDDLRPLGHAGRRRLPDAAARAAGAGRRRRSPARRARWHHAGDGELVTIWPERYRAWADANGLRIADRSGGARSAAGPRHRDARRGRRRAGAIGAAAAASTSRIRPTAPCS